MCWVFPIVTSAHQEKTNFINVEDKETVHRLTKQKQSRIKRKFPYDVSVSLTKPVVQQDVPVLKYSENVDNQSDSGGSTDLSLSSSESIQPSLKSVTTNNCGSDFGASPKCFKYTKHKIDFGSMGDYKTHNINSTLEIFIVLPVAKVTQLEVNYKTILMLCTWEWFTNFL